MTDSSQWQLNGPALVDGSQRQCIMCRILYYFSDFEKDLDLNQFDHQFLISYHLLVVDYLLKIFHMNKSSIEYFLNEEFCYSGRCWRTGERWSVPLKRANIVYHFFF